MVARRPPWAPDRGFWCGPNMLSTLIVISICRLYNALENLNRRPRMAKRRSAPVAQPPQPGMGQSGALLTAAEAARELGVKPSTLYAYVSRGLLHSQAGADSRSRLYARDDV
ncbi:MAG TPA: helix-turn-helix domain-containing protein, partial [Thermoanaerobaculia bacterium]|nr:helix-turn-helix domain-containing protein [Thermoanaerobaculia bacterium]